MKNIKNQEQKKRKKLAKQKLKYEKHIINHIRVRVIITSRFLRSRTPRPYSFESWSDGSQSQQDVFLNEIYQSETINPLYSSVIKDRVEPFSQYNCEHLPIFKDAVRSRQAQLRSNKEYNSGFKLTKAANVR